MAENKPVDKFRAKDFIPLVGAIKYGERNSRREITPQSGEYARACLLTLYNFALLGTAFVGAMKGLERLM